jgi:CheY-like chemotaxis protein
MPDMDGFSLLAAARRYDLASIIMLTSGGHATEVARCRELGVDAYLTKPLRQSDLLQALIRLIALKPQAPSQRPGRAHPPLADARPHGGLHVLVAEDNAVNQQLAVRLLEQEGHSVAVAANGRQVLEALDRDSFDLLLIDIQMPEMDGFEATAAIRSSERITGEHLPIIAMTAYAMSGDRDKCLAAGMDGYVAKPIRKPELLEALQDVVQKLVG